MYVYFSGKDLVLLKFLSLKSLSIIVCVCDMGGSGVAGDCGNGWGCNLEDTIY